MESYADMGCVLKVNVNCEACRMKVYEVLRSITGVYSVTIDAEEGLAKISGEVDPNILLSALGRSGKHAELKWVKLKSPAPNRAYYDDHHQYAASNNNYGHGGHGYRPIAQPYQSRSRALSEGVWCDTHERYYPQPVSLEYPYHSSNGYQWPQLEYSSYGYPYHSSNGYRWPLPEYSSYGYPSPKGGHLY